MPRGTDIQRLRSRCITAERRVMQGCARALVPVLSAELDREFRQGVDVMGKPFEPPKDGHRPPMVRSGTLRRSITVSARASLRGWVVRLRSDTDYDHFLRDGTSRMQARRFIPRPSDPVPPAMDALIVRTMQRVVEREARP